MVATREHDGKLCLRGDLVRAGDVLLTSGTEKFSTWATLLTAGPFSHASLMLAAYSRLEADTDGLGQTLLEAIGIERRNGERSVLYEIPGAGAALLLRHVNLIDLAPEVQRELGELIAELVTPFLGLEYPTYFELGSALPQGTPLRLFYEASKGIWAATKSAKPLEGPFCSAFVVDIFNRLNVPIFQKWTMPRNVSPNTLLYGYFRAVEGAVVRPALGESGWSPRDLAEIAEELRRTNEEQRSNFPTRNAQMHGNRSMLAAFSKLGKSPWHTEALKPDAASRIQQLRRLLPDNVAGLQTSRITRVFAAVRRFKCASWYLFRQLVVRRSR